MSELNNINNINDEPNNDTPNNNYCSRYMPCGKFIVASIISVGTCAFACSMLATGGLTSTLAPFYTSLISGSVLFWTPPPSFRKDK